MLHLTTNQINMLTDYICEEYDCAELCDYCKFIDCNCNGKITADPSNGQPIFPLCSDGLEAEQFFYWEDWLNDNGYETDEQKFELLKKIGVF